MIEIVKRGSKFFLQDSETGETVGDKKGYPNQDAAKKAREVVSSSSKLPKSPALPRKSPVVPPMPAGMAGGMEAMRNQSMPGGDQGAAMAGIAEMMRKRGA